jgi:hypothetical protein
MGLISGQQTGIRRPFKKIACFWSQIMSFLPQVSRFLPQLSPSSNEGTAVTAPRPEGLIYEHISWVRLTDSVSERTLCWSSGV